MRTTQRLATVDPSKNVPGVEDPARAKKVRQIGELLGVEDPTNTDAIRAAFEALFDPIAPANIEATGRRLGLSAREIAMLKEMKGDPRKYAELKAATRPVKRR